LLPAPAAAAAFVPFLSNQSTLMPRRYDGGGDEGGDWRRRKGTYGGGGEVVLRDTFTRSLKSLNVSAP